VKGSLRTRRQFAEVYETGRKAVGARVIAFALPRPYPLPEGDPARALGVARGIVASRRVGGAIQRNRAKRVIRAALRPLLPRLRRPLWIVLVARQQAADHALRSHEVQLELEGLFSRLDILVPQSAPPAGPELPC
jgi:ribonuclease P protein component